MEARNEESIGGMQEWYKVGRKEGRKEGRKKEKTQRPQVTAAGHVRFLFNYQALKHTAWSDELPCAAEAVIVCCGHLLAGCGAISLVFIRWFSPVPAFSNTAFIEELHYLVTQHTLKSLTPEPLRIAMEPAQNQESDKSTRQAPAVFRAILRLDLIFCCFNLNRLS